MVVRPAETLKLTSIIFSSVTRFPSPSAFKHKADRSESAYADWILMDFLSFPSRKSFRFFATREVLRGVLVARAV